MKKIITLITLLAVSLTMAQAQYYYIPHLNAGTNPGGLNNDIEQPGTTGWAVLQATSATPVWSPQATIPFSFTFNGTAYTSLIASTSGVVSFTTNAVNVPSSTSASLPNASVPDNSICVWGLAGLGSNDQVRAKTFGSAPNRQYWIQYNSYSCIGATGWTYWAIVLEETTNKIYVVDQRSYLAPLALSIGLQFNSSSALSVAGSPSLGSNATTTADDTPIDNSYFEFVAGTLPANEVELSSVMQPVYMAAPGNTSITGKITNYGSAAITSVVIKYMSGANVVSDTKTGLNVAFGASYSFTHATPLSISTAGTYPVKIWVELAGDVNHANDTLSSVITGVPFLPVTNVVFEEGTGTWCGWCPRGAVFMDSMSNVHWSNAICIAVHNADPMTVAAYDNGVSAAIPGYPSVLVNRNIVDDPSNMFAQFDDHIGDFGYADLGLNTTYNFATNSFEITVNAHFAADLSGDYRLAVVITEDNVTGATAAWDQHNYYSFQTNNLPLQGAGHNWQSSTDPVPAGQMEYDHVARALLGGFTGQPGSLPSSISLGSTHSYNFTYPIPANTSIWDLHVNALLIDASANKIMNGAKGYFVLGVENQDDQVGNFGVYPNPVTDLTTISYSLKQTNSIKIEISNLLGEVLLSDNVGLVAPGKYNYSLPINKLSNGLYLVTLTAGDKKYTQRVSVAK